MKLTNLVSTGRVCVSQIEDACFRSAPSECDRVWLHEGSKCVVLPHGQGTSCCGTCEQGHPGERKGEETATQTSNHCASWRHQIWHWWVLSRN